MEDFDLYFELIENLGAKDAQKIYARFLHIPILMNALQKEPVFTLINEILRGSPERWTPLNICKIICGIDIKTDLSQVKNGNILINSKNHALEDISTIITSIIIRTIEILKKMPESSLAEILSDGNILDDTSIKVFQSNFLLLVLISEIENSDELYSSILKLPEHSGWPVYTAKLINYYASENDRDIHGIIFQISEISARHFLLLIQELEKLGYSNVIEDLCHQYILNNANEFNRILDLEPKTLNETLLHIQELNNLLGILRFGGNEKSISENISGVIDVIKNLTKNLNSFYSENNAQKKNYLFRKNNDLLRLISNFESINSSEEIEARKIGRQILLRLDDIDVFNSIFHKDIGFLISPISLVKIFRNLEMIEESFSLAKKLLKLSPYDLDLIGFIASLTFKYGDYRSASKYFKILSVRDRISREDKMRFAISNQMIGNWRAAFSLRSEINITDQKELIDLCLCAFRSNQFKKVEILIHDSYSEFINHPVFMICQQIEKSEFSEEFFEKLSGKISCIDRNSKTIIRSLYFEQLRKVKGISAVKDLLVNEIEKNSKSQWHLIQLIGLAKNEVETDSIIKILRRVDQKPGDVPIENAIQAARLANEYGLLMHISNAVVQWEKKWILSPEMKIIGAEYKLSKGRFSEAKNQLLEIKENQDTLSDVILLDCLSTLNCRYEDFPFGISHILQQQKSVVGKWADMHPINFADCFDLRLLEIEVLMKNKSQKYEKLLKSQDLLTQKQKSQLLAVLGKSYFEEKRFDLAIINLKESLNYYCDNFIIFELIVKSYTNLQLWEEAIYQINTWLENESFSVNQLIRFQDHFHGSEQWIKFLQRKSEILPENDIYLVALSSCMAKSGRIDHAKKILSRIDFQSNNNQNITFPYIQALINCGEDITAERTIQVYLSGTRYLTPQDYLVCAAFYEKLQNLEKAIYTLRLINLKYFQVAAYKSYLLEKNTNFKEALYEILSAIEYYLNGREISELMDIDSPFIPAYIKQLLAERDLIWDNAVHLCILEGNLKKAIRIIEEKKQEGELSDYLRQTKIEINYWRRLDKELHSSDSGSTISEMDVSIKEMIIQGEIALSKGEEIAAANFLSKALESGAESIRLNILKSRLLARNGNDSEAIGIYKEVRSVYNFSIDGPALWLAEAATDFLDYRFSLKILNQFMSRFGLIPRAVGLFIKMLVELINKNLILNIMESKNKSINKPDFVKNWINKIIQDKETLSLLSPQEISAVKVCLVYLNHDYRIIGDIDNIETSDVLRSIIVYLIYKNKGSSAAKIYLNQYPDSHRAKLVYGLLLSERNPQKALIEIKNVPDSFSKTPEVYAAIAFIKQKAGSYNEAYAAISLALEGKPNEAIWLKMAGNICMKIGLIRNAYLHYRDARNLDPEFAPAKKFLDRFINTGDIRAVSVLLEKLEHQPNDVDTLLKISTLYIQNRKYHNAAKYLGFADQASNSNPKVHVLRAKIALDLGNIEDARQKIDEILKSNLNDIQSFTLIARIISKIEGGKAAVLYLDSRINDASEIHSPLILLKAEIIEEDEGLQESLSYLSEIPQTNHSTEIKIKIVDLLIAVGDINFAEEIIEKLNNIDPGLNNLLEIQSRLARVKGNLDLAKDLGIEAIQRNPFFANNFLNLHRIYCERNEESEALDALMRGLEINPDNIELLIQAAMHFYRRNDMASTKSFLLRAQKINPKHNKLRGLLERLAITQTVQQHTRKQVLMGAEIK